MCQTIIDNTNSIEELKGKEQKTALEKENAELLPLKKYKEAVLEFMAQHDTGYDDIPSNTYILDDMFDIEIIKYFSNWHSNKALIDKETWNDVMRSKEELDDWRRYAKINGYT